MDEERAAVRGLRGLLIGLFLLGALRPAYAHLGSKDVFEQVSAGPYKLFVTVRPPNVIPGVATVEVRSVGSGDVSAIHITPVPITGEASKHPPTADAMSRSAQDSAFFTGGVWMMATGSWEVRFQVDGSAGMQTTSVPVPAVAISTLKMDAGLGVVLALLGLFLFVGMAGVVAAAVREARLRPGVMPDAGRRRRALIAMSASVVAMSLAVWGGAKWWNVEAADYAENIYRPLKSTVELNGNTLDLKLEAIPLTIRKPGRSNADFLPDHGHLMHLYAIRQPEMDAVFHLHPEMVGAGDFRMALPTMPAGNYTLYGDVVHASGFPETIVQTLDVPAGMTGASPGKDDAEARPAGLSGGALGANDKLPDGYTMVWDKPAGLTANTAYALHFRLLGPDGKPARGMQPYMGMTGHAAFVKTDGTVFAHTHPEGSAAMAAVMLANGAGMGMDDGPTPSEVDFPYGFPSAGRYRIFIQMKHDGVIETGAFDATIQ